MPLLLLPLLREGARFAQLDLLPRPLRALARSVLGGEVRLARLLRVSLLRLHGDCHASNVLWIEEADAKQGDPLRSAGPHFVDFDDSRTGPAVQDLWMLLSGSRTERQQQLGAVLDGYEQFMDFDRRELALIEPLRTLRMIHHSAWIARRAQRGSRAASSGPTVLNVLPSKGS